ALSHSAAAAAQQPSRAALQQQPSRPAAAAEPPCCHRVVLERPSRPAPSRPGVAEPPNVHRAVRPALPVMASPSVLTFDAAGRAVDFEVWVDDLQLFL
ncbi:unnamed protein product, partial [Closterium sp. NIES-54]